MVAYGVAVFRCRRKKERFTVSRHLGFWAIAPVVLAVNAFWWVPGLLLASTKAPGEDAFVHREPVLGTDRRRLLVERAGPVAAARLRAGRCAPVRPPQRRGSRRPACVRGDGVLLGLSRRRRSGRWTRSSRGGIPTPSTPARASPQGVALGEVFARLRSDRGPRLDLWLARGLGRGRGPDVRPILPVHADDTDRCGPSEPFEPAAPVAPLAGGPGQEERHSRASGSCSRRRARRARTRRCRSGRSITARSCRP